MVTLWSGSACGQERRDERVAAPRGYAVTRFSSSVMIMLLRSAPIRTLSFAASKSDMWTAFWSCRAAARAASFTRFARSAPENPGVACARTVMSTSSRERDLAGVDLQDPLAPPHVGAGHDDLPIEAAWPQEGRIEDVGAVRRGDEDHAVVGLEPVHLDEELVQGLLALVVAAAQAGAAMPADGVDLIDEDDARGVLLPLLEQVAHARGADADEHLDEVRARDGEERHVRLAGDGRARRVLPVPGGPIRSTPFGMRPPSFWNFWGSRRNSMISCSSSFASSTPATSLKVTFLAWLREELGLGLAERQGLVPAALHLADEEDPEPDEQGEGGHRYQEAHPRRPVVGLDGYLDLVRVEDVDELVGAEWRTGGDGSERQPAVVLGLVLALDLGACDGHLFHLPALHLDHEGAEGELLFLLLELGEMNHQAHDHEDRGPQHQRLEGRVHVSTLRLQAAKQRSPKLWTPLERRPLRGGGAGSQPGSAGRSSAPDGPGRIPP